MRYLYPLSSCPHPSLTHTLFVLKQIRFMGSDRHTPSTDLYINYLFSWATGLIYCWFLCCQSWRQLPYIHHSVVWLYISTKWHCHIEYTANRHKSTSSIGPALVQIMYAHSTIINLFMTAKTTIPAPSHKTYIHWFTYFPINFLHHSLPHFCWNFHFSTFGSAISSIYKPKHTLYKHTLYKNHFQTTIHNFVCKLDLPF